VNRLTPQVKGTSRMSVLTEPTPRVHASFLAALREYHAEGAYTRLDPADLPVASDGILRFWVPTAPG
jgi:hypothetical protein